MNSFVGLQAIHFGESHATLRAFKGLLSCMDSLVYLQITRMGERLATIGTGNNFSCMEPLMYLKFRFTRKSLVTVGAAKGLVPCMNHLVYLQVTSVSERLSTLGAGKGKRGLHMFF
jgi:sulfite exporter TauE/SafE